MDEKKYQELLKTIQEWKKQSPEGVGFTEVWAICHDLAEAQYQPALKFFSEGLYDSDWNWRETCLEMIGFHYKVSPEGEIIDRVRELLASDPDDNVRMTAANVLGVTSRLPDQALVHALTFDADWFVRRSAYLALLQLAGVSYEVYVRENERFDFEKEEPEPTIEDLKRTIHAARNELSPDLFQSNSSDE